MSNTEQLIKKLRILLVEDDKFLRQIHTHVLKSITDEEILTAHNGHDAKNLFFNHPVDLLITDMQMPEMNGLELIKQIRCGKTQVSPALPIIAVSTYSNPEVLAACIELEINGFLVKPISGKGTYLKIKKALSEKPTLTNFANFQKVNTNIEILQTGEANKEQSGSKKAKPSADEQAHKGRKVSLDELESGMVLQSTIQTKDGRSLLEKGKPLNDNLINRLHDLGPVIDQSVIWVEE